MQTNKQEMNAKDAAKLQTQCLSRLDISTAYARILRMKRAYDTKTNRN